MGIGVNRWNNLRRMVHRLVLPVSGSEPILNLNRTQTGPQLRFGETGRTEPNPRSSSGFGFFIIWLNLTGPMGLSYMSMGLILLSSLSFTPNHPILVTSAFGFFGGAAATLVSSWVFRYVPNLSMNPPTSYLGPPEGFVLRRTLGYSESWISASSLCRGQIFCPPVCVLATVQLF
jgi:hypothetical protein